MGTKKIIHCKDGLTRQQELQARRIRRILLDESKKEEAQEIILLAKKEFDMQYGKNDNYEPFDLFLKRENPVLKSAMDRMNFNIFEFLSRNNLFCK